MIFHNFAELQTYCEQHGITLAQAFIGQETANSGITTAELYEHMEEQLNVMEASVERKGWSNLAFRHERAGCYENGPVR